MTTEHFEDTADQSAVLNVALLKPGDKVTYVPSHGGAERGIVKSIRADGLVAWVAEIRIVGEQSHAARKGGAAMSRKHALMKTSTPTKARISRVWIERKRGECMFGVIAKAVVVSAAGVKQTLCSGGTWHEDAGAFYDSHELGKLRSELSSFGFGQRAIDYAFKRVERKEIQ